uniref:RRM domain-containing protein n=1 Tax=Ditylenchus dipsaci TaxID=166011 RepID=A0A915EU30_9BILA
MKTMRSFEVIVDDFPKNISHNELIDYFSSFGETPLYVRIMHASNGLVNYGYATFASEDMLNRVLSARSHEIAGNYVDIRRHYRDELTLCVGGLHQKTTSETLHAFYSKFGTLSRAEVCLSRNNGYTRGYAFVTFDFREGIDAAFNSQPHVIDDKKVDLLRGVGGYTLTSRNLPPSATEEDVRNHFAPFGNVIDCEMFPEISIASTTFSSEKDLLKALKYAPNVLHGQKFITKPIDASGSLQRKVLIAGLGSIKSKIHLKTFFSIYGKVVDCDLKDNRDFGFVVFASAKDAETVLRSGPFKMDSNGCRSVFVHPFL